MADLKIVSLSVKGINHVVKERCQVAMLQETHLSDTEHIKLRRRWMGQVFYSSFNSKNRGVAILDYRSLPFTFEKVVKDIYAPNYIALGGDCNCVLDSVDLFPSSCKFYFLRFSMHFTDHSSL
uniref:Endonuclease/exonuclease/phosphatase domain-containing protein n=1 Tax=Oryzias melastigma TaxID=30732 RepID=A0A3B3C6A0_ORYME